MFTLNALGNGGPPPIESTTTLATTNDTMSSLPQFLRLTPALGRPEGGGEQRYARRDLLGPNSMSVAVLRTTPLQVHNCGFVTLSSGPATTVHSVNNDPQFDKEASVRISGPSESGRFGQKTRSRLPSVRTTMHAFMLTPCNRVRLRIQWYLCKKLLSSSQKQSPMNVHYSRPRCLNADFRSLFTCSNCVTFL